MGSYNSASQKLNVHRKHLEILLKYGFWFRFWAGPKILHFQQALGWFCGQLFEQETRGFHLISQNTGIILNSFNTALKKKNRHQVWIKNWNYKAKRHCTSFHFLILAEPVNWLSRLGTGTQETKRVWWKVQRSPETHTRCETEGKGTSRWENRLSISKIETAWVNDFKDFTNKTE